MVTERLPDWETRLAHYMASARDQLDDGVGGPTRTSYCALYAAGAAEAMTGENPSKPFRGRFAEVAKDLEATIAGVFAEVHPALAQRGDWAWHEGVVGVVMGDVAYFIGEQPAGTPILVPVPRADWAKAWAIGRG